MNVKNIAILQSRKATMAVISAALGFWCIKSGFTMEQTMIVVGPIAAYIPIEGAADYRRAQPLPRQLPPSEIPPDAV